MMRKRSSSNCKLSSKYSATLKSVHPISRAYICLGERKLRSNMLNVNRQLSQVHLPCSIALMHHLSTSLQTCT